MIPRYSTPEMAAIWSDAARMGRWLEIELLVAEALAKLGVAPVEEVAEARRRAPVVDDAFVARVGEREAITDHDVAAFVDVAQAAVGGRSAAWIHYGLTSSDVVDTALCWMLRDAADVLVDAADAFVRVLAGLAREHRATVMVGRTHGMHAEPTTFGFKVALWALQVARDRDRLCAARERIAVCKLSGAVGTYSNVDPQVEQSVGARLGLTPVPATQVISRDRHAEYLWACAAVGVTLEMIAVELRHLQRTEVGEVHEGFKPGQKGSSAMPHKRNPIAAETISGLSRVLRGNLLAGMQDVALWHERDISHSSVERVVLPDSSHLAHYVLRRGARLVGGLDVDRERMRANLDASHGVVFSQPVLLALVRAGMTRDDAYRIVQRAATTASTDRRSLRGVLETEPEVARLPPGTLDDAFDLDRSLRHTDAVFTTLESLTS